MATAEEKKKKTLSFSLSSTLHNSPYSNFCLCGYSKSGRTSFANTFPDKLWLDFDHGLETISDEDQMKINFSYGMQTYKIMTKVFRQLKTTGEVKDSDGNTFKPKTLIIDTGSSLCDHMAAEIKAHEPEGAKPRPGGGDGMYLNDYNILQTRYLNLLEASKDIPNINVIWIFNLEKNTDELLGGFNETPAAIGKKLPTQITHKFNEVYYFSAKEKDGEEVYKFHFKKTDRFPYSGTKTKGRLLKKFPKRQVVDPSWDLIKGCFGSKKKKATKK